MNPVDSPILMNRPMVPRPPVVPQRTPQGYDWPELPTPQEAWPEMLPVAGIELCYVLDSSVGKARREEGWLSIRGCEAILVKGLYVALVARGTAIPGASIHDCPTSFRIEQDLADALGIESPEAEAARIAAAQAAQEAERVAAAARAERAERREVARQEAAVAGAADELLGETPAGKRRRP